MTKIVSDLSNIIGGKNYINSIIKPGAKSTEVVKTVRKEMKPLSAHDYFIVWLDNTLDYESLLPIVNTSSLCKIVFVSQPYLHYQSAYKRNWTIYQNNEKVWKICEEASKTNKIKYFECNNGLGNQYFRRAILKNNCKSTLMKEIKNLINNGVSIELVLIPLSCYANINCEREVDQNNHST